MHVVCARWNVGRVRTKEGMVVLMVASRVFWSFGKMLG